MAKDIKALELLNRELSDFKKLSGPPDDLSLIEDFDSEWSKQIESANHVFEEIGIYTKAISELMEQIRKVLAQSTEKVQQRIIELIDSVRGMYIGLAASSERVPSNMRKLQPAHVQSHPDICARFTQPVVPNYSVSGQ